MGEGCPRLRQGYVGASLIDGTLGEFFLFCQGYGWVPPSPGLWQDESLFLGDRRRVQLVTVRRHEEQPSPLDKSSG